MSWYLIQYAVIVLVSNEASIKKILYDTIADSDYTSGVFSYLYALFKKTYYVIKHCVLPIVANNNE